jgi:Kef-type K+ transport system membrane component KefB/mannitol/fructose-specific phosphotransferase system IIA component (Ntr-type)
MTSLSHHDVTIILLGLGTLLAVARIFGEIATYLRQPAIIGEILAGIVLGPTVLGHEYLAHDFMQWLFPPQGPATLVIKGVGTVAVVLFLLVAGMEVDLSRIFRQGRAAMSVSLSGILVPFAIGLAAASLMPDVLGRESNIPAYIFALFFATALSISALPVIARTLMDLNLYRTDLGMVVIAAAIFDDLTGWIIFAIVLALITPESTGGSMAVGSTIALTLAYVLAMLTLGRWLIHRTLPWLQAHLTWPGGVLAFAIVLAFFGAAFAEWIGVHAVFGSFMVGVALGDSHHLRERTRSMIEQFVGSVFAPLFFASIGLRTDFVAHFDALLVLIVLVIAIVSKVIGCGLGARWAGLPWRESWAIGFGMNSRGAMEIILGLLAKEAGVIGERMFVALVVMALVTSLMSGSIMQRILRRKVARRFIDHLHPRGFINPLRADERDAAIAELAQTASTITGLPAGAIAEAVLERERMMPTGLGLCVAVPHARLHGMNKPVVCLGISRDGIEFSAPDGERSRMIFLILTPADDDGAQLEILADISRTFLNAPLREAALHMTTFNEFIALLKTREPMDSRGGASTDSASALPSA